MGKGRQRGSTRTLPRFESLTADGVGTVFSPSIGHFMCFSIPIYGPPPQLHVRFALHLFTFSITSRNRLELVRNSRTAIIQHYMLQAQIISRRTHAEWNFNESVVRECSIQVASGTLSQRKKDTPLPNTIEPLINIKTIRLFFVLSRRRFSLVFQFHLVIMCLSTAQPRQRLRNKHLAEHRLLYLHFFHCPIFRSIINSFRNESEAKRNIIIIIIISSDENPLPVGTHRL